MNYVFLTGATGLLGRYLIKDLTIAECRTLRSFAVYATQDDVSSVRLRLDVLLVLLGVHQLVDFRGV